MADQKPDIYAFIGARIRQERKARNLTLEELASIVGIDPSYLQRIEANKKQASLTKLQNIAEALDLPLQDIFRDAPRPKKPDLAFSGKLSVLVKDASPNW